MENNPIKQHVLELGKFWEEQVEFTNEGINAVATVHQPIADIQDVKNYLEDRIRHLAGKGGKYSPAITENIYALKVVNELIANTLP